MNDVSKSPSSKPLVTIHWDERNCEKHYNENRNDYIASEETYKHRKISIHMLRNGVPIPNKILTTEEQAVANEKVRKQPSRSTKNPTNTRGRRDVFVDACFKVPRLHLLAIQEFTTLAEDISMGRLQFWLDGKKLASTGTLFSEGVKPGAIVYLKVLPENDEEIEREFWNRFLIFDFFLFLDKSNIFRTFFIFIFNI